MPKRRFYKSRPAALVAVIVIALVLAALIIQPVGAGEQTFDSEEFRSDLVAYFADLEQAYSHVVDAGGSPEPLDAIQGSQSLVAGMTGEAPTVFGPDAETTAPRAVGTESTSLLSHSCPEGHIGGLADEIALRASAITAQQAMEVLPTDTAGNVARVAFTVLWIIAEEELQAAEAKNALAEQCEQDNHRSILHNIVSPRVDIAVSTRATQTSVANIDADVAAHDTNIDARVNEIRGLVGGIGETLDTTVEMKYVHLQVIEVKRPPSLNARHRVRGRYLLIATEAGGPVDVTLTGLNVSIGAPNGPISFVDALGDATATSVATGTLDIDLRVAGNTKIFQFLVEHSHGPDPSHFGATMFHRAAAKNIGPGQFALGLAIIFTLGILNFAHGSMIMVGAYGADARSCPDLGS